MLLTLDNSDRRAPLPFNEQDVLEVTRRIERDRGSLYRINGREVRARDVQLLFADNATGAQSTAIVSQGRVGALINARPADRRHLLEEAAGISGLHSRRHEAELRLRAAETNLERLEDVIGTLESQLNQLRRQVRQATLYATSPRPSGARKQCSCILGSRGRGGATGCGRSRTGGRQRADLARRLRGGRACCAGSGGCTALREADQETVAALQRLMMNAMPPARSEAGTGGTGPGRAASAAAERRPCTRPDLGRDAEEAIARLEQEACALEEAAARDPRNASQHSDSGMPAHASAEREEG